MFIGSVIWAQVWHFQRIFENWLLTSLSWILSSVSTVKKTALNEKTQWPKRKLSFPCEYQCYYYDNSLLVHSSSGRFIHGQVIQAINATLYVLTIGTQCWIECFLSHLMKWLNMTLNGACMRSNASNGRSNVVALVTIIRYFIISSSPTI